jgi:putative phosphoesterase
LLIQLGRIVSCYTAGRIVSPVIPDGFGPAGLSFRDDRCKVLIVGIRMAMERLARKTASMAVRADGSARLAVVADTHSQPHPATADRLAEIGPDAILHAGDVGDLGILDALARIAPVYAVRGNIDGHARDLPDVLVLTIAAPTPLRILMTHIALYGPKLRAGVAHMAKAEGATLVVCGHSHVPFIGSDRGLTVFNPGSIGPRRFTLPIVLGMLDLTPAGLTLAHVDAATGQTWLPP